MPLLAEGRAGKSPLHRLDARAKILGFVGFTVVVVSTPAHAVWAFILYATVLVFLLGLARVPPAYVLRRILVVVPFLLVVACFLPFFHRAGAGGYSLGGLHVTGEGLLVLWNAGAKAVLGALSMIVLGATTGFSDIVWGFERLRAPKVLILIVGFMYRYSFVFVEEARRMRRAMTSRNYRARWLWNIPVLGHMLGALFLRSYSRGERVYVAMLSRGYEGTIHLGERTTFGLTGAAFVGSILALAVTIRTLASIWGAA
ncbi:MAG: cobalt ECF transporter T component CbiQ [Actinobacteria bacterium RBG_16_64_13]|nr:MAG: cobalt ECF transporter T component CbiQ [Actinobacteria bacterium RBG_16_64_13]